MVTKTITLYEFSELDPTIQQRVLNKHRDINTDHQWWDFVYDDTKTIAMLMGIDITNIYFSGFWSQGDGAHFLGDYSYKKGSRKAVREYAPKDTELHRIADDLFELQHRNFYALSAKITRNYACHYEHSGAMDIEVERYDSSGEYELDVSADTYAELCDIMRSFANWIYDRLEDEYDYLTSEEAVRETIEANEFTFRANGGIEHV